MTDKRDQERDADGLSRRAALVSSTTGLGLLACALSGCAMSFGPGLVAETMMFRMAA